MPECRIERSHYNTFIDFLYGIFGTVARVMERMSHTRGNGIPGSWALLAFSGILTALAAAMLAEALKNSGAARSATVGQIIEGKMTDRQVTVKGTFSVDDALVETDPNDDKKIRSILVPLTNNGLSIYVRLQDRPQDRQIAGGDHVTGIVRRIDNDMKDDIASASGRTGVLTVNTQFYLNAGEHPANGYLWLPVVAVGIVVCAVMLIAICVRYVIFRLGPLDSPIEKIHRNSPAAIDAQNPIVGRVSGIFAFAQNPKVRRRFLGVPAVLSEMASGDKGLSTSIDASEKFMGSVTKNLAGIWSIVFQKGSIREICEGWQYLGFKPSPALRFRYADAMTGRARSVVVSFASEEDREIFRGQLG